MFLMTRLSSLKNAKTRSDLARLLDIKPSSLTYLLFHLKVENLYESFEIKKASGGNRVINAPDIRLKEIQSKLSYCLLDCLDEINEKFHSHKQLSHGFERDRSIITNAARHLNKKNVANIDLQDFFGSFNFGRVRGYFIKNENFALDPVIATTIAQIACYQNALPQGSPCSPVISNLITHSLDIRLAYLAKRYNSAYSRYADDITFSTREREFPAKLFTVEDGKLAIGSKIVREIERAGFTVNPLKTRTNFKNSRQDVTGLVVNNKVSIKSEYWRKVRSMCHKLFETGNFYTEDGANKVNGNIPKLEGMLSFIDSIDKYNNFRPKAQFKPTYVPIKYGANSEPLLNVREKTYSKFLFFKNFHINETPTILCEGKTDNIYLSCAIKRLVDSYPELAQKSNPKKDIELKVKFFNNSKKTRYLMNLYGGTSYLKLFIEQYLKNKGRYTYSGSNTPVIIILDNDDGPKEIVSMLKEKKFSNCPDVPDTIRSSNYIHIFDNLYIIFIPKIDKKNTELEDFFDHKTLSITIGGKSFNRNNETDSKTEYGKHVFSQKIVMERRNTISFDNFKPILDTIVTIIEKHAAPKAAT
ncbi:retron Ec67 family RNA-directed DNA polymerase/endonuclease [Rheinheimera soli]|uniref:RNA-directed DNA polymerase n=1 Tax=Rheinheimera soli TaxID=443616 RepID=A0ABU1W2Q4_9GAMM|nr:retron Ec67 family RNA-directed DNA polymerase/endonuclease [Rheinheimera soli]MDR7122241.1 retron-type reverse transcriptase [Rheinheimera soli]